MAVYTEVTDEELAAFLARYDLGEVISLKGIAEGVENSNFILDLTSGRHILTLYERRVREEDLPFYLGLMEHLSARGITCPTPVRARDGTVYGHLCGRPAAIVTFLDGVAIRRPTAEHCAQLGQAIARLHRAGADFPLRRANALSHTGWRQLFEATRAGADRLEPGLEAELGTALDSLEADWPTDLPAGVIHADLFPDNVFFLRGRMSVPVEVYAAHSELVPDSVLLAGERLSGLIDFYFACNDFLAYDVAICLNAWCFEPDRSFSPEKAKALLTAYAAERPFSAAERAALPLLARGAAMRFLLTRLYDSQNVRGGALVVMKDPLEYLAKLRFHAGIADARDYGLD